MGQRRGCCGVCGGRTAPIWPSTSGSLAPGSTSTAASSVDTGSGTDPRRNGGLTGRWPCARWSATGRRSGRTGDCDAFQHTHHPCTTTSPPNHAGGTDGSPHRNPTISTKPPRTPRPRPPHAPRAWHPPQQRTRSPRSAPRVHALIDARAASELLSVPYTWLLAQARARRIPHHRLGHYVRFDPDDLKEWLCETRSVPRGRC